MKKIFYINFSKGLITIEILIAFTVFIINLTAVVLVINKNQSISIDTEINNKIIYRANSILEKIKSEAKLDFNLVKPIPFFTDNIFEEKLSIEQLDLFTKKIISHVVWKNKFGQDQKIEIIKIITNPEAVDGGDTCSSIIVNPNNWKQPLFYIFSSENFSGNNSSGINISDIDVFNNKLYISALNTLNSNNDTFFILELKNNPSEQPIYLGSLDNNPNSISGINKLKISKNYAYIANAYTGSSPSCIPNNNCAQLQIIDINDSKNPIIISNLKIPTITSNGKLAAGTSIFYRNGYVYLGLAKATTGNEFNIIDVGGGGPPASHINPILRGGYSIGNGINSIFVKNNIAYIASPNNENIIILDINNPDSPQKINSYTPIDLPNTNGVGSNHGKNLSIIGYDIYLGRTYGPKEFYILDGSNLLNILNKGLPLDIGTGNRTSINKLIIRDYLAFFITPSQFQIWDINDVNDIKPWSIDGTSNNFLSTQTLGGNGLTMDCENNYFYIAISSSFDDNKDIISIITEN